jgi:hypothetical protein
MSLEEMESTWNAQPALSSTADAQAWIDKSLRSFRTHAVVLLIAILGNGLLLGLQIHRLVVDPDRTLANSTWELLVPALTFLICLGGVVLFRRSLRQYRALSHDTRGCLELILKEKQREITALTRWIPATYVGFLGLIALGKLQSIAAEFESPGNAWSGVWMAALFFFVTSAFPFHRARVFVEPEVRELRQTLHSLVSG